MINQVNLSGRVTKDIELKNANGKPVVFFNVAYNEGHGDKKQTHFFELVAFGKTAEHLANYGKKGKHIYFDGKLQTKTSEYNGQKITKTQINVKYVEFLDDKREKKEANGNSIENAIESLERTFGVNADDFTTDEIPF